MGSPLQLLELAGGNAFSEYHGPSPDGRRLFRPLVQNRAPGTLSGRLTNGVKARSLAS